MFASPVMVGHGGEPCSWKQLLPRYRCPILEALRVFAVRPKVGLPNTFSAPVAWFPYQSGDAHGVDSSTASSNEIPDDVSESLSPAAQYGRHSSIWAKSDSILPKTNGRNPTIVAGNDETSALPAAAAVPDSRVPTHAGCERLIEAFRGLL